MISKLLSLLSTAKGAAAATVIAAAGVTGGVAATNQDVQDAVTNTVQNVANTNAAASPSGQPAVVAARNDADKKLRDAFQNDQQKLEKLHSTKVEGSDRATLETLVKDADTALRARLTTALNDVAALTLGRNGLESPKPSGSPDVKASFTPETQTKIDDIVTKAIADMDTILSTAEKTAAALPTFEPGKPSDVPGGKPADVPGGKPATAPTARPTPTH